MKKFENRKGFSLIEVLFSLGMFAIGIFGVVSLMYGEMEKSMHRRNEAVAGALAQEGIELVRNIRDNNWQDTSKEAFDGISNKDNGIIDCDDNDDVKDVSSSASRYGLVLNDDERYVHGNGKTTHFKRRIIVEEDGSNRKKIISVTTWGGAGDPNGDPNENNCNFYQKCFYIEATLDGKWGEI